MIEIPTTGAIAEYRGKRLHIVFSGDDWVAVQPEAGIDIPDAFESGESPAELGPLAHVGQDSRGQFSMG